MPDTIALRPIAVEDCVALAALHRECFPDPWPANGFESLLQTGASGFLTESQGVVTGALMIRAVAAASEAEILTYAVRPFCRRHGIADRLMAQTIAALQSANIEVLFLDVAEDNAAAIALYRKWNFVEIATRSGYYNHKTEPKSAIVMNLKIAEVFCG